MFLRYVGRTGEVELQSRIETHCLGFRRLGYMFAGGARQQRLLKPGIAECQVVGVPGKGNRGALSGSQTSNILDYSARCISMPMLRRLLLSCDVLLQYLGCPGTLPGLFPRGETTHSS